MQCVRRTAVSATCLSMGRQCVAATCVTLAASMIQIPRRVDVSKRSSSSTSAINSNGSGWSSASRACTAWYSIVVLVEEINSYYFFNIMDICFQYVQTIANDVA